MSTAWGLRLGRRGSFGQPTSANRPASDGRDRIALDISILKRQYEKLRERQRQAHIILTSTSRQSADGTASAGSSLPVNQYLQGRSAIVSNKGRRIGPPAGAIPPIRKVQSMKAAPKTNAKSTKRSEGMQWKEINANTAKQESSTSESKRSSESSPLFPLKKSSSVTSATSVNSETSPANSASIRSHKKSESSSYSDDSDGNSSTSTSLCDEENFDGSLSSVEASPMRRCVPTSADDSEVIEMLKTSKLDECISTLNKLNLSENCEIITCVNDEMSGINAEENVDSIPDLESAGILEVINEEKADTSIKESDDLFRMEKIPEYLESDKVAIEVNEDNVLLTDSVLLKSEELQIRDYDIYNTNSDKIFPVLEVATIQCCSTLDPLIQDGTALSKESDIIDKQESQLNLLPESKCVLSTDTINLLKRIENSDFKSIEYSAAIIPTNLPVCNDLGVYEKFIDDTEEMLELKQDYQNETRTSEIDNSIIVIKSLDGTVQPFQSPCSSIASIRKSIECVDSDNIIPMSVPPDDFCMKSQLKTYTDTIQSIDGMAIHNSDIKKQDNQDLKEIKMDLVEMNKSKDYKKETMSKDEAHRTFNIAEEKIKSLVEINSKILEINKCLIVASDDLYIPSVESIIHIDSIKLCPSVTKPSKSKSATSELLENSLLMEHILNPIVNEKATIDDVLIEHFTSLSLEANKKIEAADLDIDSIEEIRRKYYASTKSLSDSLHEADQPKLNVITAEASNNLPLVIAEVDSPCIKSALLSSPLLAPNDHLSTSSNFPEIPSTLNSSQIPSQPTISPTVNAESTEEPSATQSSTVSKLSTVPSLQTTTDVTALSLKDNIASITSTSQLSPMNIDISQYLSTSSISPLRTPANNPSFLTYSSKEASGIHICPNQTEVSPIKFKVNDEGVTNEYFERVTVPPERPSRLELRSSTSDDTCAIGFVNDDLTRDIHLNAFVVDSPTESSIKTRPSDDVFDEDTFGFRAYTAIKKDHDFMKEKSFSLDEPTVRRDEFKPSSCPENALDQNPVRKSERVIRIIQENSKILHRFLRRNVCVDDEEEVGNRQTDKCVEIEDSSTITSELVYLKIENNIAADISPNLKEAIETNGKSIFNASTENGVSPVPYTVTSLEGNKQTTNVIENNKKTITNFVLNQPDLIELQTKVTSSQSTSSPVRQTDSYLSGTTIPHTVTGLQISDVTQIEGNEPKDIAETISSIKNTIKSIDTLCNRDESNQRSRDKTIEVIESLNECRYRKLEPAVRRECAPSSSRYSRDIRRETSPRRPVRESEREEYESLFKRDTTMSRSTSVLPSSSCTSDLDRLYQITSCQRSEETTTSSRNSFPPINFSYPIRTQNSTSPKINVTDDDPDPTASTAHTTYVPPHKSHIRHTTVTSTFYDRIQAQQKEKTLRMDRSPTAHQTPVNITKAYLHSLRVSAPIGFNPRSVETSPSHQLTRKDHSGSLSTFVVPPFRHDLAAFKPPYKSCDNIPEKTKSHLTTGYNKYA